MVLLLLSRHLGSSLFLSICPVHRAAHRHCLGCRIGRCNELDVEHLKSQLSHAEPSMVRQLCSPSPLVYASPTEEVRSVVALSQSRPTTRRGLRRRRESSIGSVSLVSLPALPLSTLLLLRALPLLTLSLPMRQRRTARTLIGPIDRRFKALVAMPDIYSVGACNFPGPPCRPLAE
jgi:hypothetical protein